MEQFESLALGAGAGPGQPEAIDPSQLPRPLSEDSTLSPPVQPPFDQGNCHPDNMRLTVNCIPNSAALRARYVVWECGMCGEAWGGALRHVWEV